MRRTQLTVHMAILNEHEAVLVGKLDPLDSAPKATWIGKRMDVNCTSLGKALIAYLPRRRSTGSFSLTACRVTTKTPSTLPRS